MATITTTLTDDEPCFLLTEENRLCESSTVLGRYQMLKIVRSDRLVTAYVYLGRAENFQADQFIIPGGVVDDNGRGQAFCTVAELQDIAQELRSRPPRRVREPWDMQTDWLLQCEERERQARHLTTSGPAGQLVRP